MKKNIKSIYILEFLMLIFTIMFKAILLDNYRQYASIVNIIFWIIIAIIMLIRFRFPRDKNYLKQNTNRIIIINLFSFLLVIYSLGIFTGFTKYIYLHDIKNILKNTIPVILIILSQEFIRYIVAKNSENNIKPLVILTTIYISLNIIMEISYYNFYNFEQVFRFISVICVPLIAKQLLYSYITYKVSLVPTIILRLAYELYVFIFPFYPKLGDYLFSIVGVVFPYIAYKTLSKTIQYAEKSNIYIKKVFNGIFLIPFIVVTIVLVSLISGFFKYQLIAIGSNSMKPLYARGDSVIFEHKDASLVKEGDILVFYRNNTIMTHRIIKINKMNNKKTFTTKGDNNEALDQFQTEEKDVLGVVKYEIKYLGYPTIWLSETMKK